MLHTHTHTDARTQDIALDLWSTMLTFFHGAYVHRNQNARSLQSTTETIIDESKQSVLISWLRCKGVCAVWSIGKGVEGQSRQIDFTILKLQTKGNRCFKNRFIHGKMVSNTIFTLKCKR